MSSFITRHTFRVYCQLDQWRLNVEKSRALSLSVHTYWYIPHYVLVRNKTV